MPNTRRKKYQKKIKLAVHGRRTKWAPFWAVLKKYGMGKRVHPSRMTSVRRSWRRNKLKIKPRKVRKRHLG
jgi:ribosomal protein L39E